MTQGDSKDTGSKSVDDLAADGTAMTVQGALYSISDLWQDRGLPLPG